MNIINFLLVITSFDLYSDYGKFFLSSCYSGFLSYNYSSVDSELVCAAVVEDLPSYNCSSFYF